MFRERAKFGGKRVLLSTACAACNRNAQEGNEVRNALQAGVKGNSNTKLRNQSLVVRGP